MAECDSCFGHPDPFNECPRRGCQRHRLRVGIADVLAGEDREPSDDEPRVFAAFEHARDPVNRSIGVGPPHGFDHRRDRVVVLIIRVHRGLVLDRFLGFDPSDPDRLSARSAQDRDFERGQGAPGVAIALDRPHPQGLIIDMEIQPSESAIGFGDRAFEHADDLALVQRFEPEQG